MPPADARQGHSTPTDPPPPHPFTRALTSVLSVLLILVWSCADSLVVQPVLPARAADRSPEEPAGPATTAAPEEPPGTGEGERPPLINVLIERAQAATGVPFAIDGGYRVLRTESGERPGRLLAAGDTLSHARATVDGRSVVVNGQLLDAAEVLVQPVDDGTLEIDGRPFRGSVLIRAGDDRVSLLNRVDLEAYVAGVIHAEMPERFPTEALRAQAVVARTFALYQVRHGRTLRDDQASQVYGGLSQETPRSRRIAASTLGEVLTHDGELLESFFHSTCGGHTSSARDVFGIAAPPPLTRGARCTTCRSSPHYRWSRSIDRGRLSDFYSGAFKGPLHAVAIERDSGGRILRIDMRDQAGKQLDRLVADRFRNRYNAGRPLHQQLKSALIEDDRLGGSSEKVSGRGFGHGVGLCQYGAAGQAEAGRGYRSILRHYYPGVVVHRLYE